MELAMQKLHFAVNKDVVNKTDEFLILNTNFRNCELTVPELCQVIKSGFSMVCLRLKEDDSNGTTYRNKAHFLSSQIIPLDFDNSRKMVDANGNVVKDEKGREKKERVPVEQYMPIESTLSNPFVIENALLAYTTCSHKFDFHRYRVFFVLPEPISDVAEYQHILKAFIWKFNSDKDCSSVCQPYYGNTNAEITIVDKQLSQEALNTLLCEYKESQSKGNDKGESKVDKSPDFPKISLDQIDAMLGAIKKAHPALDYIEWLTMIGGLYQKYSYDEVLPLLQKHYPELDNGEYLAKYNSGLEKIPFYHFIKYARKCGYNRPITYGSVNYVIVDDGGSITFNQKRLLDYLHNSGYRKYYLPESNSYIFVIVTENIVKQVVPSMVKDHLRYYLETNYEGDENKEQILNQLYCGRYTATDKLEYLLAPVEPFARDDDSNARLMLSNGLLHV